MDRSGASWRISDIIAWTTGYLAKAGSSSPRLDAELLLAHTLATRRINLYMDHDKPLQQDELARFKEAVKLRVSGMCVAHITGTREFWKLPFRVESGVFVPRPETELLVEYVLDHFPNTSSACVIDLCCGVGPVGVTLAAERRGFLVTGVDINPRAIHLARENAAAAGVSPRVDLVCRDVLAFLDARRPEDPPAELVTCNPPYVPAEDWDTLSPAIRRFEPIEAVISGNDGLDLLRKIIPRVADVLAVGGRFVFEYSGPDQTSVLEKLLLDAGFSEIRVLRDLANIDRAMAGKR
jgi:release factor glutamine methyltransferase